MCALVGTGGLVFPVSESLCLGRAAVACVPPCSGGVVYVGSQQCSVR